MQTDIAVHDTDQEQGNVWNNNPNRCGSGKERQMHATTRTASMAVLIALGLALAAGAAKAAEPPANPGTLPPLGHKDFYPSPERPIGFRGDGSGHFPGANPPDSFSEKEGKNVLWSVKMPDWGQSSPIIVGKRVITAAEPDTTLCVDADTGKVLWQDALDLLPRLEINPDGTTKGSGHHVHLWSGNGYSWPCSDGQRVYKVWISCQNGSVTAAIVCYDVLSGKREWLIEFSQDGQKHKFKTEPKPYHRWAWRQQESGGSMVQPANWAPSGYNSPALYRDLLIYLPKEGGGVVALDSKTGALRWASKPGVLRGAVDGCGFVILALGSRQVLVTDIGTVLDPTNGEVLGEAIPSIERDGKQFSRLWGLVERAPNGAVVTPKTTISPIFDPGREGIVAFGPDWPLGGGDQPWDQDPNQAAARRGAAYCYLAVRLAFDGQGKLTTSCLFPERAVVPKLDYGNGHMVLLGNHLVVLPGYGHTLATIALDSGKLTGPPKRLWEIRNGNIKPDANDPGIRAALEEFRLTIDCVTEPQRGIGRGGWTSYSRTFVDGRGHIWYMNRQAQFYRINPAKNFDAELVGSLVHPLCWTTTSNPVPHGNRIYVRTFGRLACIGEK